MRIQTALWLLVLVGCMLANVAARRLQPSESSSPASTGSSTVEVITQGTKGSKAGTEKSRPNVTPPEPSPSAPPDILVNGLRDPDQTLPEVDQPEFVLKFRVVPRSKGTIRVRVGQWRENREIAGAREFTGLTGEQPIEHKLTLRPGTNEIRIQAANEPTSSSKGTNPTKETRLIVPYRPRSTLAGDVLVLVLQTDFLGKGDPYLKMHLAKFRDRNRARLLGGEVYLLDGNGPARPWKTDLAPARGTAPFHDADAKDLPRTFRRVVETLEAFQRRAGNRSFETLLMWKSDLDAVGAAALKDVRKPDTPMMVYWLTEGNPDTRVFEEWLGGPSVTCLDFTRGEEAQLWVSMEVYLKQKRNP